MILLRQVPSVVGSREGWELYIVSGGVTITSPVTIYSLHPSLLPMTLGICLSRIIFYSLVIAFQSAEACRRIMSASTLNG
jgi:hypothetical protein